jgi:hypothetical protein
MNTIKQLKALGAGCKGFEWAKSQGDVSWQELLDRCPRADWAIWVAMRRAGDFGWPTHKEVILVLCDCVETVSHLIPVDEDRSLNAIKIIRLWTKDGATKDELSSVVDAAFDAANDKEGSSAHAAYAHVTWATYAVAINSDYSAAAFSAYDAVYNAAYAIDSPFDGDTHQHDKMMDIIRMGLEPPQIMNRKES